MLIFYLKRLKRHCVIAEKFSDECGFTIELNLRCVSQTARGIYTTHSICLSSMGKEPVRKESLVWDSPTDVCHTHPWIHHVSETHIFGWFQIIITVRENI